MIDMVRLKKAIKCNKGESISEALVTFLISTISIMIIAVSIVTAQKMISSGEDSITALYEEKTCAENFLTGAGDFDRISQGTISISSNGYLYSEEDIEMIVTNKRLTAFR